ncbi:MAG: 2-oxoglutarate dehydrogenase E2 component (dihydrolipoamide succinyltransferase) [Flavobacteriales bacterium]|jgi:2-oxoglutarate dehydrogenase E2 component (dihydrolipoamide succinyltransferase)
MSTEIKAPTFPESVQDGTIVAWHKQAGDAVSRDELLVEVETDKVVLEVVAPADGVLTQIAKPEGEVVVSNELLGVIAVGASAGTGASTPEKAAPSVEPTAGTSAEIKSAPAARKLANEKNIDLTQVTGTGKGGLITKEDVMNFKGAAAPASAPAPSAPAKAKPAKAAPAAAAVAVTGEGDRIEKRVPMTRLRTRIAERLLEASQTTAMLTTFNEVDMGPVMELRKQYKDKFEKVHNGTRLGFMGFFVKAAVEALRRFPAVNASIDGNDIVYHGFQDIGVAVSTEKGLVVPVLRNAENLSLAGVEAGVRDFGMRARDGKISLEEMIGGTFTITNGGVFGSLMSTPILNPPQSAILGMHKIQDRPMAVNGEVKIRPMMYLALSYDHRIIDGKDAVQFLVAIKDLLEDPARILLEV